MADELFEGIQILSPRELAATGNGRPAGNEEEEEEGGLPSGLITHEDDEIDNPGGITIVSPKNIKRPAASKDNDGGGTGEPNPQTKPNAQGLDVDLKALANVLSQKGLLELAEDASIENDDDLLNLVAQSSEKKAEELHQSWLNSLPPKAKAYMGLVEEGMDADLAAGLVESREFVSGLNANSDAEDLEQAYRLYLSNLGMTDDEINEEVEEAKDLSKLKDKALKAKDKLLSAIDQEEKTEKARLAAAAQKDQEDRAKYIQTLEASIESSDELVPGIKLTPKMKEKIKNSFLTSVGEVNGRPINQVTAYRQRNPQAFDILLHYYTQLGLFNINEKGVAKPDISALKRKVATETTSSLLDIVTAKADAGDNGASAKTTSFLEKLSKYQSNS